MFLLLFAISASTGIPSSACCLTVLLWRGYGSQFSLSVPSQIAIAEHNLEHKSPLGETGADLGGGCRGCAPPTPHEIKIQLIFCK